MHITTTAQAVELHFPPLRAPGTALALGIFGLTCLLLPLLAAAGLLPRGTEDAYGLVSVVLIGVFIAPFPVFGVVFLALAVYLLGNSLTVRADRGGISATRRLFGVTMRRRWIPRAELAAVDAAPAARYMSVFSAEPCHRIIARHAGQRGRDVVVADAVPGDAPAAQVRALIAQHAGLDDDERSRNRLDDDGTALESGHGTLG